MSRSHGHIFSFKFNQIHLAPYISHIISHPVLRFPGNETWSDQIAQVSAAGDRRLVACEYKTHTANKFDEIPTAISRIPDYHYGLV